MTALPLNGPMPILSSPELVVPSGDFTLDLSTLEWASPFDVAVIAAIAGRKAAQGRVVEVKCPDDEVVHRYLVDLGVRDHIPGSWGAEGGSAVDPPLIRLTRLDQSNEWDAFVNRQWPVISERLQRPQLASGLFDILGELVDNATTHGTSEAGTYVCVQRYSGRTSRLDPGLWIGVADAGIGIPSHLRRRHEYAHVDSDPELIKLARQPNVTGTRDRRGWGLVEVFEQLAKAGLSRALLRSGHGEARYWFRGGRTAGARYRVLRRSVPGTWIHAQIRAKGG